MVCPQSIPPMARGHRHAGVLSKQQAGFVVDSPQCIGHDVAMGSAGDKPRKPRRRLAKVPKYEEPNALPLPGLTGGSGMGLRYGRFGHGSDHKHPHRPGRAGALFLRTLGMRPKG